MKIELLTVSDCPNRAAALDHLRAALDRVGSSALPVLERVIDDEALARAAGMRGSPTVLIDGRDPFTSSETEGSVSCRLYRTPTGVAGAPSVDDLAEALSGPSPEAVSSP